MNCLGLHTLFPSPAMPVLSHSLRLGRLALKQGGSVAHRRRKVEQSLAGAEDDVGGLAEGTFGDCRGVDPVVWEERARGGEGQRSRFWTGKRMSSAVSWSGQLRRSAGRPPPVSRSRPQRHPPLAPASPAFRTRGTKTNLGDSLEARMPLDARQNGRDECDIECVVHQASENHAELCVRGRRGWRWGGSDEAEESCGRRASGVSCARRVLVKLIRTATVYLALLSGSCERADDEGAKAGPAEGVRRPRRRKD